MSKKKIEEVVDETPKGESPVPTATKSKSVEIIEINKAEWDKTQEMLKMLYATADKGRIFNYESGKAQKKPLRIKLSEYNGGIIVGWRTVKDELIPHPTTGKLMGEVQQYEILLDKGDEGIEKILINGYPNFSEARYGKRFEAEVKSRSEDFEGNIKFDIELDNGRIITLDSRFVN